MGLHESSGCYRVEKGSVELMKGLQMETLHLQEKEGGWLEVKRWRSCPIMRVRIQGWAGERLSWQSACLTSTETQIQSPETNYKKQHMVAPTCDPSMGKVETGGSLGLCGQPAYPTL